MAKTTERHIAHIRDIFPEKDDVTSTDSHAPVQSGNSILYKGLKASKPPTNNSVKQTSNSEVFFTKPGSDARMNSVNGRGKPTGGTLVKAPDSRNKRLAPQPPENTKPKATNTGKPTQTDVVSLPTSKVTGSANNIKHQLDRDRDRGQYKTNTGQTSTDIKSNANHGDRPYRNGLQTEAPSSYQTTTTSFVIETNTTRAPMSGPMPPMNSGGLLGNNIEDSFSDQDHGTCAASLLSDSGTASSSSGYTSEGVPDHLHLSAMNGSRTGPLEGVPDNLRLSAMNGSHTGPLVETQGVDQEFDEDECTMDFGDEEDVYNDTRHTRIYKEYQGEDFSRYLKDDADSGVEDQDPVAPPRKPRYHKRKDGSSSHSSTPSSNQSTMTTERKKGMKQRISQMFTLSRQHKGVHSNPTSTNNRNGNIQNFSFADSKIGVVLADSENTSEKENAHDKKFSDIGLPKTWWNTDTLSARSLRNNSEVMVQKKRANSVGDILDTDFRDFNSNHGNHAEDFESTRKARMYDSKGRASTKQGFWSKLTKTLKKKDKTEYEQNRTMNPLVGQDPQLTDVRL